TGSGQGMSNMPDMEHEHHGGAAASQQPPASASRKEGRSQPASGARKSSASRSGLKHRRAHPPAQGGAHAQHAMPGMQHGGHDMGATPGMQHGGHDMGATPGMQHGEHGIGAMPGMGHGGAQEMGEMRMQGQFGPYPMSREASGTAWQPDSTPLQGVMLISGEWMLMGHANLFGVYDDQGGPRGASKTFAAGMVMGMAQRPVGDAGTLGFRAMLSPDPFIGANGYPLVFVTGENANGLRPLVDRQSPHGLFLGVSGAFD